MSSNKPERLAIDGEGRRVALVAARYNFNLVNGLLESVLQALDACGVRQEDVETFRVPGSNEVPYAAAMAAKTGAFDVVIALGVVIAGETDHHSIIAHASAQALQTIGIRYEIPVINGIITVQNEEQARARVHGPFNRGIEFAHAALEMAAINAVLIDRIEAEEEALAYDDPLNWDLDDGELDEPEDWRK